MTKKSDVNEVIADLSVDDVLSLITGPKDDISLGSCVLMRKIALMPQNIQDALAIALPNKDVTNRDLLGFINSKTDQRINLANLQDHRNTQGCIVCLYGAVT